MDTKNEGDVEVEEPLDLPAEPADGEEDTTDWKAEAQKLQNKAIAQRERTKAKNLRIAELEKAVSTVAASKEVPKAPNKTGELDEATLDFFELKGFSDPDQVDVFAKIMHKTGMSHRDVIKDEYALAKVKALQDKKEVKEATPSSTKRGSSGSGDTIATALAKYEQSGYDPSTLPTDFALRSAVVNATASKSSPNRPAWHK